MATQRITSAQQPSTTPKGYTAALGSADDTVVETAIIATTIPADDWADNEVFIIDAILQVKVDAVAVGTVALKLKYGATSITLVAAAADLDNTAQQNRFRIELWRVGTSIYVFNTDGTSTNPILASPLGFADFFAAPWTTGDGNSILTTQTFNADKTLQMTAQWSVANANNTFGCLAARVIKS